MRAKITSTNSGSDIAGGARGIGPKHLQPDLGLRHQISDDFLAREEELDALLALCAESIQHLAIGSKEQQTVYDAKRGRLSWAGWKIMNRIAARDTQTALALERMSRDAAIMEVANHVTHCPHEASLMEQQANEPLNEAQILFAKEGTAVRAMQVASLASKQERASRVLADAAGMYARRTR